MFCFLRYSLDWQLAPGTELQPTALKNDRTPASRMSTLCGVDLEPNLRPLAPRSWLDRNRQTTYEGMPQGKTINDKRVAQLSVEGSVC
jgi:hypothetical protein